MRLTRTLPLPLDTDLFTDYKSFMNASLNTLNITPQSSITDGDDDNATPSKISSRTSSPSRPQTKGEPRKRGRPRMLDVYGSEVATKKRRQIQVRQAQRAYRSRKEEQMAVLSQKVTKLEQKLLIARGIYLSTHALVMSTGLLSDHSASPSLRLFHNLQLVLANTKIQVRPTMPNPETMSALHNINSPELSLQLSPGVQPPYSDMLMNDMIFGQDMAPHGHDHIPGKTGYGVMF
ncbi:hypothetical protein BJX62DRAFT_245271 [Aspergillus germanicus]